MCNMFNLVNSIRIFRIVEWIMSIIEQTFHVISLFLIMLIPLQIGFGFFSTVQFGPNVKAYVDLMGSMKVQIITMMGQQDSFSLMRCEFWFTIIWTMLFILYFAYFFITASICAFEDGFDEAVKSKGYPEDFAGASGWYW